VKHEIPNNSTVKTLKTIPETRDSKTPKKDWSQ